MGKIKKAGNSKEVGAVLRPVESDVRHLLDMFEFFLTERQLGKPIDALGESVRDMRLIIGRILIDHYMALPLKDETKFCKAMAEMLADRCAIIPIEGDEDQEYHNYCISEILTSFEYAHEVKSNHSGDKVLQKILALDLPILRPFNYGLRGKFKILKPEKKKRIYS